MSAVTRNALLCSHDSSLAGIVKLVLAWDEKTAFRRFFHIYGMENIMKTICYVDGFNLYYGCLKNTRHKWLDIHTLFSHILKEQDLAIELVELKFFTALLVGISFAPSTNNSQKIPAPQYRYCETGN
jgi:hypothetical protein